MNVLLKPKRIEVLKLLAEGCSMRSVNRLTGVHRATITGLMVWFGKHCRAFLNHEMRDLELRHVQLDEIWTFVRMKNKTKIKKKIVDPSLGSMYIFVALDDDTSLIPAFWVGKRNANHTYHFCYELAQRLKWPKPHAADAHGFRKGGYKPIIRITTDKMKSYPPAIDKVFGPYAQFARIDKVVKENGAEKTVEVEKELVKGNFDLRWATTSLVERQNLTIRTFMGRMKRKQLSYSKKLENLRAAVAMYVAYYNYCWVLATLGTTPAVAAGICRHRFNMEELYERVMQVAPYPWEEYELGENDDDKEE